MAGVTLKIDGHEVIPASSGGTVVNITLHKESGLAYLCKAVSAALSRNRDASAKEATAPPSGCRPRGGEQKALGVAQILLGAICIGLGVVLSMLKNVDYYYEEVIYNGIPFWMGSLFILSGTFSVVGARHGGKWVHLATFLNLASMLAGSVAFTLGLTAFPSLTYQPDFVERLCKRDTEDQGYRSWKRIATTDLPYDGDSNRVRQCEEMLWSLVNLWSCTHILLLVVHIAALTIALFCFGYGLRRLLISCLGCFQDYTAVVDPDESKELGKEPNVV